MRTRFLLLAFVALALTLAGCSSSGAASPTATIVVANELKVGQNATLGQFLTDSAGMTLYVYENDTTNISSCTDTCAQNWPPLVIQGDPAAGTGVDGSLLDTTERADGTMQVTYNEHPLYHYGQDKNPGDTNGQGFKELWHVISPAGDPVVK